MISLLELWPGAVALICLATARGWYAGTVSPYTGLGGRRKDATQPELARPLGNRGRGGAAALEAQPVPKVVAKRDHLPNRAFECLRCIFLPISSGRLSCNEEPSHGLGLWPTTVATSLIYAALITRIIKTNSENCDRIVAVKTANAPTRHGFGARAGHFGGTDGRIPSYYQCVASDWSQPC